MNRLQIEALSDLFEYRRKVKIALGMKKHPMRQLMWCLFSDVELVKLMWAPASHLSDELEYVDYEVELALAEDGKPIIQAAYAVLGYERPGTI